MLALLGNLSPKFWFGLFIAVIMAGLGLTTEYYHNRLQAAQEAVVKKQTELDAALLAAKTCSDQTDALRKSTDEKTEFVKKAQEQAAILAKGNQAMADKLLQATATNPDTCVAASQLFKDYKAQTAGK